MSLHVYVCLSVCVCLYVTPVYGEGGEEMGISDQVFSHLSFEIGQQSLVVSFITARSITRDEEVVHGSLSVLQVTHTKLQVFDGCRHLW